MNAAKKTVTDDEYIEILDDIYDDVDVCGYSMRPGGILYACDNIAFNEAKCNYEYATMPYVCTVCEQEFDEFEHADNCCKIDHLVDMLEQLKFVGVDSNLKISLLEYGILYQPSTGYCIICRNPECLEDVTDITSILFGTAFIDAGDIESAIADMPEGFFDYVDSTHDNYQRQTSYVNIINDIKGYNGLLCGDTPYDLDVDYLIGLMQTEIDLGRASNVEIQVKEGV